MYGDLFVANSGNGFGTTVSEFSAASLLVPAPTGTVDFSAVNTATNQTTDLGSETLTSVADDSNATATLAVPSGTLPAGTYVVTATYEGESNVFAGSNTELAVGATTVAVSASPTVSSWYQPVALTATIVDASGSSTPTTPTGTVDFFDVTTQTDLGDAPLVNGVATLPVTGLVAAVGMAGDQDITANYSGDANFATNSGSTNVTVLYPTTTNLDASPGMAISGQPVTLTATVAANLPSLTPTGYVDFTDDTTGAFLGTEPLVNGAAVLPNAALPTGTYAVTATYEGEANGFADSSAELGVGADTVTPTASPVVSGSGLPVTLTATVADATGGGTTPTGNVDFFDTSEDTDLGTASVGANGVATLMTTGVLGSSGIGKVTITADYSGDTNFGANSESTDVTVVFPTTTSLQTSPTVVTAGQPVTLTATVGVQSPGTGTPDGTVDFVNVATGADLGTATLSGGVASLSNVSFPAGTYAISAIYSGDAANSFAGSTGYADMQVRPVYGSQVTVSVQLPSGETVTFEDGNTPIGTATSMDGTASLTTSASAGHKPHTRGVQRRVSAGEHGHWTAIDHHYRSRRRQRRRRWRAADQCLHVSGRRRSRLLRERLYRG